MLCDIKLSWYICICLTTVVASKSFALENDGIWQSINVGGISDVLIEVDDKQPPIVVAIIDDGFRENHPAIEGFTWVNTQEIANNNSDDDGNSVVDDIAGWDVADGDGDVSPPGYRLVDFYHGTFVASVIADLIRRKLGQLDTYPVQFMYIKAVPDASTNMLVSSGYAGIKYAVENGADIINNSWDGGVLDQQSGEILNSVRAEDIFVVNSVGNFPSPLPSVPASHVAVFGVAGSDASGVITNSNYGSEVDITAPSIDVIGADITDLKKTKVLSGTSFATPMVSATAALMKLANRDISASQIRNCLHNTATLIDYKNPMIAGKIGAGMLNVDGAIECARDHDEFQGKSNRLVPKGSVGKLISSRMKANTYVWNLSPVGVYQNLTLFNSVTGKPRESTLTVTDTISKPEKKLWSGKVSELPPKFSFDVNQAKVTLTTSRRADFEFQANYQFVPIDFEKRYCSERIIVKQTQALEDGSGELNYAALSDCEWLIEGRDNHSVSIDFTALEIDQSDTLHVFSGESRQQTNLLMTVTGNELPPKIMVNQGPVLLWLVSDGENQAQGFSAKVDWVENN